MPPTVNLLVDLLLPPTSLAVFALVLLVLGRRFLAGVLLVVLVALSMPLFAHTITAALAPDEPADAGPPPSAIVILSADVERLPDGAEPGSLTLERERAGVALARRTGLPILVTGGVVVTRPPVGQLMAESLTRDFLLPPRWVETASATTWENARFSAPLLQADGIRRVYLVTHEWHMRRALLAFRRAGLDPVAAPVRPTRWPVVNADAFMPRASGWRDSYLGLHEWLGLLFYRVRPQ